MHSTYLSVHKILFFCFILLLSWQGVAQKPSKAKKISSNSEKNVAKPLPQDTSKKQMPLAMDTTKKSKTDTLKVKKKKGDIETTVLYSAEDSITIDMTQSKAYLYRKTKVIFGQMQLTAGETQIDWANSEVKATGRKDTAGKIEDKPLFKDKNDQYQTEEIRYNFKTQNAFITGVATKQGEGLLRGTVVKKTPNNIMYVARGFYTTCDLPQPHYMIRANKIKVIPEKSVITGAFNLVIDKINTPLGFAFGMFPFTEKNRSGLIMPTYGSTIERGYFLRGGGFFWSISPYANAAFTGEIYTNGTWGLSLASQYAKRYYFQGNLKIDFRNEISGRSGDPERPITRSFWVSWTHNPVKRGEGTFSASVNAGSVRYNARNSFIFENRLTNNFASNISYSRPWRISQTVSGTFALNVRHNQNSQTGEINISLPDLNFAVNRISPFKKQGKAPKGILENFNFQYNMQLVNNLSNRPLAPAAAFGVKRVTHADTLTKPREITLRNLPNIFSTAKFGVIHNIPFTTTLKLTKYISLNPTFNYREAWYVQRLNFGWDENQNALKVDTLFGFQRVGSYNMGAGVTTRLYGIFNFSKRSKIQSIRHTLVPTIGFTYQPTSRNTQQTVTVDNMGRKRTFSVFQGFEPAPPTVLIPSGSISISLDNIFEMKVRPKGDTGKPLKINILDNLNIATNYNLFADSLKLSIINFTTRTNLFKIFDLNFVGSLDPYQYVVLERNERGQITNQTKINQFAWQQRGGGIGTLSTFNAAVSFSLTPKSFSKKTEKKVEKVRQATEKRPNNLLLDPNAYVDFDVPFTLAVGYNFIYNKTGLLPSQIQQTLNVRGDVSLTKTWKIGFNSGYDFKLKRMSTSSLDFYKDLHCWEMRFQWIPFGTFQSFNFDINVKSALLKDLRISRRRTWYDR
ncbi:MAG: putative LPS assembly protein LptD [Microscillaceae bacterium]|nr:putative LPS assembly protein LptD [Microscillaceae bacterium]MDW8460773.1 putative LPS assembly protein LptD [Cytophagales bacterium]